MLSVQKKPNPQLLKEVLNMSYKDILNLTLEKKTQISLIEPPKGYKLVQWESKEPTKICSYDPDSGKEIVKYFVPENGSIIGGYFLEKENKEENSYNFMTEAISKVQYSCYFIVPVTIGETIKEPFIDYYTLENLNPIVTDNKNDAIKLAMELSHELKQTTAIVKVEELIGLDYEK